MLEHSGGTAGFSGAVLSLENAVAGFWGGGEVCSGVEMEFVVAEKLCQDVERAFYSIGMLYFGVEMEPFGIGKVCRAAGMGLWNAEKSCREAEKARDTAW